MTTESPESEPEPQPDKPSVLRAGGWKIWAGVLAGAGIIATTLLTGFANQLAPWLPSVPQAGPPATAQAVTNPAALFDRELGWDSVSYVIPLPPQDVPPPPAGCLDRQEWAHELGGVDASSSKFEVVLLGNRAEPVTILGVDIDIAHASDPVTGTHAACPTGGASEEPTGLLIELDGVSPSWTYRESTADDPSPRLPLVLSRQESDILRVEAFAGDRYFEWTLRLLVADGSGQEWITVTHEGAPFVAKTSSESASDTRAWYDGTWSELR